MVPKVEDPKVTMGVYIVKWFDAFEYIWAPYFFKDRISNAMMIPVDDFCCKVESWKLIRWERGGVLYLNAVVISEALFFSGFQISYSNNSEQLIGSFLFLCVVVAGDNPPHAVMI